MTSLNPSYTDQTFLAELLSSAQNTFQHTYELMPQLKEDQNIAAHPLNPVTAEVMEHGSADDKARFFTALRNLQASIGSNFINDIVLTKTLAITENLAPDVISSNFKALRTELAQSKIGGLCKELPTALATTEGLPEDIISSNFEALRNILTQEGPLPEASSWPAYAHLINALAKTKGVPDNIISNNFYALHAELATESRYPPCKTALIKALASAEGLPTITHKLNRQMLCSELFMTSITTARQYIVTGLATMKGLDPYATSGNFGLLCDRLKIEKDSDVVESLLNALVTTEGRDEYDITQNFEALRDRLKTEKKPDFVEFLLNALKTTEGLPPHVTLDNAKALQAHQQQTAITSAVREFMTRLEAIFASAAMGQTASEQTVAPDPDTAGTIDQTLDNNELGM